MALTVAPGAVGGHQDGNFHADNPPLNALPPRHAALLDRGSFTFTTAQDKRLVGLDDTNAVLIAPDATARRKAGGRASEKPCCRPTRSAPPRVFTVFAIA